MVINGKSPVWHARRKKLLHMFNRWSNNFARIGTAYLHLTAGYTDMKNVDSQGSFVKKKYTLNKYITRWRLKMSSNVIYNVDLRPALGSEVQGKGCRWHAFVRFQ